jgi:hypothetical protein
MKIIVTTVALATFLAVDSRADLVFSAPGMTTAGSITTAESLSNGGASVTPQDESEVNINYWSYTITGFEWALAAGTPTNGIVRNGGQLANYDGSDLTGESSILVTVNGKSVVLPSHNVYLVAENVKDETGTFSVVLDTPIEVEGVVTVNFALGGNTNMTGDSNSFIKLNGYASKTAPGVVGSVFASSSVQDTAQHCDFSYTMKRLLVQDDSLDFDVVATEQSTTSLDSGHGNNDAVSGDLSGVDDDNKGKAPIAKWVSMGKITVDTALDADTGVDTTEGSK